MRGLMMEAPLLISSLIRFAAQNHAATEIVSRSVEGPIHRYTYGDAHGLGEGGELRHQTV